jgi:hypothetical protein
MECTGHGNNMLFLPFIFQFLSKKTTLLVFLIFLMFLHLHRRPLSRRRPSMRFVLFFFPCFILFVFHMFYLVLLLVGGFSHELIPFFTFIVYIPLFFMGFVI